MIKTVSIETLTDEEIERLSDRRVKKAVGGSIEIIGSTTPNHAEVVAKCECTLCRNGQRLDKAGKAVCLRCSRASERLEAIISAAKAEVVRRKAESAVTRVNMVKARAMVQMRCRGGARLNAATRKIVMSAIRNAE